MADINPFHFDIEALKHLKISENSLVRNLKCDKKMMLNRTTSLYSQVQEWKKTGKNRFVFGPAPDHNFGPKALLSPGLTHDNRQLPEMRMFDPSQQTLVWQSPPKNILIIKKPSDSDVAARFKDLAKWLIEEKNINVIVEEKVLNEEEIQYDESFHKTYASLNTYQEDYGKGVDLVVCLGGDGTLLHVSSMFQRHCPPVIAFHLGSLGFLTPFSIKRFKDDINDVFKADVGLTLRSRLKCQVRGVGTFDNLSESYGENIEAEYLVLNEVVIDRGIGSSVTHVEIYCNGKYLTTLLGDGLIISTPTGSTAYSMSAGASLVHPSVPGIVLTPICPHSLSFRPIVLPAGVELKIIVSTDSRNHKPMCSFDGRYTTEMNRQKYLRITTSVYPVPCISHQDHLSDWFNSLAGCLHWNKRELKRSHSFNKSSLEK